MRVLITGAFGQAGRAVLGELEHDHELVLLDRHSFDEPYTHQMGWVLPPFETKWPVHRAPITDVDAVRMAMSGVDAVVHLAGHLSTPHEETIEIFRDNAYGTFVVLDAAARAGAQRVIVASSIVSQVPAYAFISNRPYEPGKLPIDEDDEQGPEDTYSLSKRTAEEICAAFHRHYGLTTAALRLTWLFPDNVYRERAERPQPTTEWEAQLWTWIHIQDVANAIRLALESPSLPGHGVYLLSAGDTYAPEPSIDLIRRFRPELMPRVVGDLEGRTSLVACWRAREAFGFSPKFRFPW